jgi:glycine/D-amino acid oxidase-like deaminating enzyme
MAILFLRTTFATFKVAVTSILLLLSLCQQTMSLKSSTPFKNIVVVGGGIQGTSVAYHLAKKSSAVNIVLLESVEPASAASGKGGGFMARSWGDGSPTQRLHELAFDMYENLAKELGCKSYRKLPVLSVTPGYSGVADARKDKALGPIMPGWLDGEVGRISAMGFGDDTAQITPKDFVTKMLENRSDRIHVVLGTCCGVETDQGSERGSRKITGVKYRPRGKDDAREEAMIPADAIIVSAGPWSCEAEEWFQGAVELPMEGIKSTSIVWKKPDDSEVKVDATALFCGEDHRFGTHCKLSGGLTIVNQFLFQSHCTYPLFAVEVYPRPDGTIYLCGIGGSDYISKEQLKDGAFREVCEANEARVEAAMQSFQEMSSMYQKIGTLEKTQACMRPCPPDAMPYMGRIRGYEGAFINAGHNCW